MKNSRKQHPKTTRQHVEYKLNTWLLPLLIGLFGILYLLTGYRGWLVVFIGTLGVLLIAIAWIQSLQHNLSIERKINLAWATVGESVHEELKLVNQGWLPVVWVEITDASDSLETPLRIVSEVSRHTYRTRHLSHLFKRRGVYTLGPTRVRSSDPFGIFTLTLYDQHASTVLITPPILPLAQLKIPSGGWAGDDRRRREIAERNISDAGIRNYVAGDSVRRIHWPATAHFDTLIVRQLEAATTRDWLIYVDLDGMAQAGVGQNSTLELSIILAASLAVRGLKEHRRVGLVLAGPQLVWLEPGSQPVQRWRILRNLAMAQAGNRSLADLISLSHPSQSATSILITPSNNPAWVAATGKYLRVGSLVALLVDPFAFGSLMDQNKVISMLALSRIPYFRMPASLLQQAYSSVNQPNRRKIIEAELKPGSLQPERQG
jgi:uncharacterized protein (DUF58 family)